MTDRNEVANHEKLIEEAAKAMANVPHVASWDAHTADEREWYLKDAEIALAVFEKAHTPTDDERVALLSVIINAPESGDALHVVEAERVRDAVLAAGFRRSEVPEPSATCPSGCPHPKCPGKTLCCCAEFRDAKPGHAEPQGEPSDAQVDAAASAWGAAYHRYASPHDAMRAALRAANEVR